MDTLAEKLKSTGVHYHAFGIGLGVRGSQNDVVMHFFEGMYC